MHRYTDQAVALPGPLTLAWFPFAQKLPEQVAAAAARGHEAMLHMPMQISLRQHPADRAGPAAHRPAAEPSTSALLRDAIDAVPAIVGVNNHMGTVATLDPLLMELVAREVHAHGMLFLDSVVVPHSVALCCAELAGVPAAARDVFIDNVASSGDDLGPARRDRGVRPPPRPRHRHCAPAAAHAGGARGVAAHAGRQGVRPVAAVGDRGLAQQPGSGAHRDLRLRQPLRGAARIRSHCLNEGSADPL